MLREEENYPKYEVDNLAKVSKVGQFDLRMPPHGGIAIGLERLTAQILNLPNMQRATLYPRGRTKLTP
jgi:nondiscriminating aspartyl-tRNA synthetase